ncbi:MAG: hypothetical protein WCO60_20200 [Verrucomicrobiota bacterium]
MHIHTIIDDENPAHLAACQLLCGLVADEHSICQNQLEQMVEESIEFEMDGLGTFAEFHRHVRQRAREHAIKHHLVQLKELTGGVFTWNQRTAP